MVFGALASQGRVGRTTLLWSLACLLAEKQETVLYEIDVAFPKLLSFFPEEGEPVKRRLTEIDPSKCTLVGKCFEVCNFGVIKREDGRVFHRRRLCRGCGACREVCPQRAIVWEETESGKIIKVRNGNLILYAGKLAPEEGWEGYLARKLKEVYPILPEKPTLIKAPLGLSTLSLRTVKEAEGLLLVTCLHPGLEDEIKIFGEILQGFGLPGGIVLSFVEEVPEEVSELVRSLGLQIWPIPLLRTLSPGQSLFEAEGSLRSRLEEILALGGGVA